MIKQLSLPYMKSGLRVNKKTIALMNINAMEKRRVVMKPQLKRYDLIITRYNYAWNFKNVKYFFDGKTL